MKEMGEKVLHLNDHALMEFMATVCALKSDTVEEATTLGVSEFGVLQYKPSETQEQCRQNYLAAAKKAVELLEANP